MSFANFEYPTQGYDTYSIANQFAVHLQDGHFRTGRAAGAASAQGTSNLTKRQKAGV